MSSGLHKIIWIVVAVGIIFGGVAFVRSTQDSHNQRRATKAGYSRAEAMLGEDRFVFRVTETPEQKQLGLGATTKLGGQEGMLFPVEPHENPYGMWMKGMRFPIDIVWLDGAGVVIHIAEEVQPATYPEVFANPGGTVARTVLEVPSGTLRRTGVKLGDTIHVQKIR